MKKQKIKYWTPTKGLFFPDFYSKTPCKRFDGKLFKLDSYSTKKSDVNIRKADRKEEGYKVRIVKIKKFYYLYMRKTK